MTKDHVIILAETTKNSIERVKTESSIAVEGKDNPYNELKA